MTYVADENNLSEYSFDLSNGGKKIIKYHYNNGVPEGKLLADCMTIYIYNSDGTLVSKETKKNPDYKNY